MNPFPQLLIDIGNTSTTYGVAFEGSRIHSYSLPTDRFVTPDALGLRIVELARLHELSAHSFSAWIVTSVVPQLDPVVVAAAQRFGRCRPLFATRELPVPLENCYARPQEVGADRLVGAYAATRLYDAPGYIVVDFGTATTFDCVDGQRYLGGLIFPGLGTAAAALSSAAAKLPQADLRITPGELQIGRSTSESLNSGLMYGYAAMTEGLVERLRPHLPQGSLVIATGGLAARLAPYCKAFDHQRPDLLLEGLFMLYAEYTARQGDAPCGTS